MYTSKTLQVQFPGRSNFPSANDWPPRTHIFSRLNWTGGPMQINAQQWSHRHHHSNKCFTHNVSFNSCQALKSQHSSPARIPHSGCVANGRLLLSLPASEHYADSPSGKLPKPLEFCLEKGGCADSAGPCHGRLSHQTQQQQAFLHTLAPTTGKAAILSKLKPKPISRTSVLWFLLPPSLRIYKTNCQKTANGSRDWYNRPGRQVATASQILTVLLPTDLVNCTPGNPLRRNHQRQTKIKTQMHSMAFLLCKKI